MLNHSETAYWLVVALVAAGIYGVGLLVFLILLRYFDPVKRQLNALALREMSPLSDMELFAEKLDRFSGFFLPRDQRLRNRTIDRLAHAGYRSPNRLLIYYALRLGLMAALPGLVFLAAPLLTKISLQQVFSIALVASAVGMVGPSYYLDKKIARQQKLMRRALPDAIDLLVVCTEAGLGLNAALVRVALALADIHPSLAEELLLVTSEIRAGVDRNQALLNLVQRTGLDDMKGFVSVLGQSMRFGTSIAQALRIYADEFRDKRMQKADEEAATLATKMVFPLALCFLPGFFIVALGPSIVSIAAMWTAMGR